MPLPFYPLLGNHDTRPSTQDSYADHYQSSLGPLCYSFDYGGLHVCMYDLCWEETHRYRAWLDNDLNAVPKDRPCILVIHDGSMPTEFYDSLPADRIVAVLGGHWHTTRCFAHNGRRHYELNPIVPCGSMDASPTAYRRFRFDGQIVTSHVEVYVDEDDLSRATFSALTNRVGRFVDETVTTRISPGEDWATFHGPDGQRSIDQALAPPLQLAWRSPCPGGALLQSPIVADGKVFMPSQDEDEPCGYLSAFDLHSGEEAWTVRREAPFRFCALWHQNRLFCAGLTGEVIACDADDGGIVWTHQMGDPTLRHVYQAPVAHEDSVLVGTAAYFACLNAKSGAPRWVRQDLSGEWAASYGSAVVQDDRVYVGFGGQSQQLWCLDVHTGQTIWEIPGRKRLGDGCSGAPVVGQVGHDLSMVFYHRRGPAVVAAFCETGQINWTYQFSGGYSYGSPAFKAYAADAAAGQVSSGVLLFTPRSPGALACLQAREGFLRWQWQAPVGPLPIGDHGRTLVSSPLVTGAFVHVTCLDGTLRTLEAATGHEMNCVELGAPSQSSPVACGNVLVAADCSAAVSVWLAG